MRLRELGVAIGDLPTGRWNAITDVAGVRVGHATLIHGEGPLRVGAGPIRTGVTVVLPHDRAPWLEPVFAGAHRLNGNGEVTGLEWLRESGMLTTPVGLTNSHSVGVVRDALVAHEARRRGDREVYWSLPVVGETCDVLLNDINGMHVRPEHVEQALSAAAAGPVTEGSVGGGTGMICHGFKGGVGTASRVVPAENGGFTVGVLVQANHGRRERFVVDGRPIGRLLPASEIPEPDVDQFRGGGSIIAIVATDAPLLPGQCARLAQRAGLGVARTGGVGEHDSGDLFVAFATGNEGLPAPQPQERPAPTVDVRMLDNQHITPLFDAVVDATQEAIVNAVLAAETMVGRDGITAHGLPAERLAALLG